MFDGLDEMNPEFVNKFLDIILYYANKSSFTYHFVRQSAKEINDIFLFEKNIDFFQYFGICQNDKKILTILIPEKYYTNIDYAYFDKKISELISKFVNNAINNIFFLMYLFFSNYNI